MRKLEFTTHLKMFEVLFFRWKPMADTITGIYGASELRVTHQSSIMAPAPFSRIIDEMIKYHLHETT
jgi:hypothetical protein